MSKLNGDSIIHFSYNLDTNNWADSQSMSTARYLHAGILVSTRILLMGGIGHNKTYLSSTEYFDPKNGESIAVAPMLQARNDFTAGIAGDFVYVMGGMVMGDNKIERPQDTSIERYSVEEDIWTKVIMTFKYD